MSEQLARIDVHDYRGTPVVSISGDVDLSNANTLSEILQPFANEGPIAIDMTNVMFIDSTGLNAIAQYGRRQLERGYDLFLIVTRPPLLRIFEITRFDQHFTVLSSLDDLP
jgi:anti-sigma B factor antagonist